LACLAFAAVFIHPGTAHGAEGVEALPRSADPADREGCAEQLTLIFEALEHFRQKHTGALPAKLSDLRPDFLHDRRTLTCPFVERTGGPKAWRQGIKDDVLEFDPFTTYSYEFCLQRLPIAWWRGTNVLTFRAYKERQRQAIDKMGKPGSRVPLVRCFAHEPNLNLACDGHIYPSDLEWENGFADPHDALEAQKLFPDLLVARGARSGGLPARQATTPPQCLDLSGHFTGQLTESLQGFPGDDLAALLAGMHRFGSVPFDVRGVIQLDGKSLPREYPLKVESIKVGRTCSRIHFLHGTAFIPDAREEIGRYVVHYADGQQRAIPLIYGREVVDWWINPRQPFEPTHATAAWTGANAAARSHGRATRLYQIAWENPLPDEQVASLSFRSALTRSAPFLVAVTVEP
jgi:hypothetical protein